MTDDEKEKFERATTVLEQKDIGKVIADTLRATGFNYLGELLQSDDEEHKRAADELFAKLKAIKDAKIN